MEVQVETYSGYKADERPVRFKLGARTLGVKTVLDRWYGPDYSYFKVLADDGNIYILRHHPHPPAADRWTLTSFRSEEAAGRKQGEG